MAVLLQQAPLTLSVLKRVSQDIISKWQEKSSTYCSSLSITENPFLSKLLTDAEQRYKSSAQDNGGEPLQTIQALPVSMHFFNTNLCIGRGAVPPVGSQLKCSTKILTMTLWPAINKLTSFKPSEWLGATPDNKPSSGGATVGRWHISLRPSSAGSRLVTSSGVYSHTTSSLRVHRGMPAIILPGLNYKSHNATL